MIAFKVFILLLFLSVLLCMIGIISHARQITFNPNALAQHRKWANVTFWLTLVAIIMTELFVRLNGGVQHRGLLMFHLCFACPFFVLLGLLRFRITGLRQPILHRKLASICMVLYGITLITGFILLWIT